MSEWGVWKSMLASEFHIVPCDSDGNVLGDHNCSIDCFCQPKPTFVESRVILHHDPKRGGTRDGVCN